MILLTYQKNEVFDLIEKAELDTSKFEWGRTSCLFVTSPKDIGNVVPADKLTYKETDFYYLFGERRTAESHYAEFSPGESTYVGTYFSGSWIGQIKYVERWLSYLKREVQEIDKWDRIQADMGQANFGFNYSQGTFSEAEYQVLSIKIESLKQNFESIGLQKEQIKLLQDILEHTKQVAKEMNKVDWKNLFLGSIMAAIAQLSLSQDMAKVIWSLIKESFNKLLLP